MLALVLVGFGAFILGFYVGRTIGFTMGIYALRDRLIFLAEEKARRDKVRDLYPQPPTDGGAA
jgi:hypothetical protein